MMYLVYMKEPSQSVGGCAFLICAETKIFTL